MAIPTLDEFRLAQQSLAFCVEVWREYRDGWRSANEHMDEHKALDQLLQAIDLVVQL